MSFFIKNKKRSANVQGKKGSGTKLGEPVKKKRRSKLAEEEIESDSDIASDAGDQRKAEYDSSEEEVETAQEKKLRLAKQYLAQLEEEEGEKGEGEEDITRDIISHRLKQEQLEQAGRLQKQVADSYEAPSLEDIITFRGHQLSVTCVVISPDGKHIYSGSKDCSIIKWSLVDRRKVHTIHGGRKGTEKTHLGHTAHVLSMAISSDGKYLASGDRNKLIHIWSPDTLELLHTFKGHRDAVSGLAFRRDSHQLFSASHDRSVKVWNVDERAYVETLFGHQDNITAVDSLSRERAITAGGRDGSIRIWKIIEESQLIFHGHNGSIDCVALINESNFISGADDNTISLWSVMKKKPLATVKKAHPGDGTENWITAVASLQNTDLIASGSRDGCIRLWKCASDYKFLKPLFQIPVKGFISSLQFSRDGQRLVAGVGQEHNLGRWWRIKDAKNSIVVIQLKRRAES